MARPYPRTTMVDRRCGGHAALDLDGRTGRAVACQGKDEDDAEAEVASGQPPTAVLPLLMSVPPTQMRGPRMRSEHCAIWVVSAVSVPTDSRSLHARRWLTYYLYEMPRSKRATATGCSESGERHLSQTQRSRRMTALGWGVDSPGPKRRPPPEPRTASSVGR